MTTLYIVCQGTCISVKRIFGTVKRIFGIVESEERTRIYKESGLARM